MNRTARQIGMYSSYFDNPHGLSNTSSLSTAEDVAKLCIYAMSNTFFRSIVETKLYQKWENTNKLLK